MSCLLFGHAVCPGGAFKVRPVVSCFFPAIRNVSICHVSTLSATPPIDQVRLFFVAPPVCKRSLSLPTSPEIVRLREHSERMDTFFYASSTYICQLTLFVFTPCVPASVPGALPPYFFPVIMFILLSAQRRLPYALDTWTKPHF